MTIRQFLIAVGAFGVLAAQPFVIGLLVFGNVRQAWAFWRQWATVIGILAALGCVVAVIAIALIPHP